MDDLKNHIKKGVKMRRILSARGKSRMDLGDLTEKVAYWVSVSPNVLKTALKKRDEILIVLPPNFRGRFLELINEEK